MSVGRVNSGQTGSGTASTSTTTGIGPGGRLDKQAFLMLLVAQLKNQDPLNPMQDREFITQLAQLNTLEQLQQLNETIAGLAQHAVLGQVASFLGKTVTGLEQTSHTLVSGEVVRATVVDGAVLLELAGGQRIDVRDVVSVEVGRADSGQPTGSSAGSGNGDGVAPTQPGEAPAES